MPAALCASPIFNKSAEEPLASVVGRREAQQGGSPRKSVASQAGERVPDAPRGLRQKGFQPGGPVPPLNPRNSKSWCRRPTPTLFPWHWAREPVLDIKEMPHGGHSTSAPQMVPDPEKGRMVMGSPPKPRLRVSSERSCGSGRISPLLSPSPAAGRRAGWRGGLSAGPPRPQRQAPGARAPQQGAGQCPPVPGKESSVGGRSTGTRQLRTQLTPFPQPRGFLLYRPTQPGLAEPPGKAGGKESVLPHAR